MNAGLRRQKNPPVVMPRAACVSFCDNLSFRMRKRKVMRMGHYSTAY